MIFNKQITNLYRLNYFFRIKRKYIRNKNSKTGSVPISPLNGRPWVGVIDVKIQMTVRNRYETERCT